MQKHTLLLFFFLALSQWSYAQVIEPTIDTAIVTTPDVDAEFAGGFEAFQNYIISKVSVDIDFKKNKSLPKEQRVEGGRVIVRFVVEKDGSLTHLSLQEELPKCQPCNEEALRAVNAMPKWTPAMKNGAPVRSIVRVPLMFSF
jgi:protein TonB